VSKIGYTRALAKAEATCRESLGELAPAVADIAFRYETTLEGYVAAHREAEHRAHPEIGPMTAVAHAAALVLHEEDKQLLAQFREEWFRAVAIQAARLSDAAFADYLARLKNRRMGVSPAPSRADRAREIASAAATLRTRDGY
jgi:hypothetical protein